MTIYRGLLTTFLLLVAMLSGAILAITIFGVRHVIEALSGDAIGRMSSEAEVRLEQLFRPAQRALAIARGWGEVGLLPIEQPDAVNAALMPMLREFPQITSALVADTRGRENMLLRLGDTWKNRRTRVDLWGRRSEWAEWRDREAPTVGWRELGYDPRTRPWYTGAVGARGEVHWTPPYTFFTTKDPGITASVTFEAPDGVTRVVGFDLMLRDISAFTRGMSAGPLGKVFVMSDDGRIVGLPDDPRLEDEGARKAALLRTPAELGLPLVDDSLGALAAASAANAPVRFTSENRQWWAARRRFELAPDRHLQLVVTVSEDQLLRGVRRIQIWIVAVISLAVVFALWRAAALARRFSRPVEALVRESDRIGRGDLEGGEPIESEFAEVQRLASAHDSMRGALRTLLELERDLQIARQIQRSTFPDRLPTLAGFQLAAWSEPAAETGGDTYDLVGIRRAETGDIILADEQPERVLLLLADATGHGVGPALSVTQVRAMLRIAVRGGLELEAIVRHLNEQLCQDLIEGRFVTVWLAELSASRQTIRSFSAAQGPLLHYVAATGDVDIILPDTFPLGLFDDMELDLPPPVVLQPGDIFACISDGIFDAENAQRERFGSARVIELLKRHRAASAEAILDRLKAAVADFTAGAAADDDRTVVLVKRL